jgi:hypothetical protein
MRAIIPVILALMAFSSSYGRQALVDLTLYFANEAGEHQRYMMSLGSLNHSLLSHPHARHRVRRI